MGFKTLSIADIKVFVLVKLMLWSDTFFSIQSRGWTWKCFKEDSSISPLSSALGISSHKENHSYLSFFPKKYTHFQKPVDITQTTGMGIQILHKVDVNGCKVLELILKRKERKKHRNDMGLPFQGYDSIVEHKGLISPPLHSFSSGHGRNSFILAGWSEGLSILP